MCVRIIMSEDGM